MSEAEARWTGRAGRRCAWALAVLVVCAPGARAQERSLPEEPPSARLTRLPEGVPRPVLDGRMDDEAWKHATALGPLTQVIPIEGVPPSEATEVFITFDRDALFVAVHARDRDPSGVIATAMARDASLSPDDRVGLVLDTFHDHRNAFFFSTNANGARFDGLIEDSSAFKSQWDGIWNVEVERGPTGFIAEFEIPFKTLSFDPDNGTWGFNVLRSVRRRNEDGRWANAKQNRLTIDVSQAGNLTGLVGLEQGIGLDVVPGVSAGFTHRHAEGRAYGTLDPSLDAFYRVTPSVTAALTVNTDFSDAPVDARQVNLSRFALFFPETRDFFLQDAGIFDFPVGDSETVNGTPFFSRRIGLDGEGGPVPIRAGAKVTGRVGPLNLGLLDVQMAGHGDVDAKNLAVGRVKLNFGEESFLGLVGTHGDPLTNGSNSLFGADVNFRTSRFRGDKTLVARGWAQHTTTPGTRGRDHAFGARLSYPNDRWNWAIGATQLGHDFFPALGFVNRTGIRRFDGLVRRRARPVGRTVRIVEAQLQGSLVLDLGNDLESLLLQPTFARVENQDGDFVQLVGEWRTEVLDAPFEISDGVVIDKDRYDFGRLTLSVGTATARPIAVQFDFGTGSFFGGHIRAGRALVEWRASEHFFASVEYLQNSVRLPGGDFTTRLGRVRVNFVFSPNLSWETFLQFDNIDDSLGWNSRLRWILRPGQELALIWNQAFDVDDYSFRGTRSNLVGQLRWTFRF